MGMHTELLSKLKELKDLSRGVYIQLEEDGLKVSDPKAGIAKEQLFQSNIKNVVSAVEGLLRGEAAERHLVRLKKEFPDSLINIKKVKEVNAGMKNRESLMRIEALLTYLENNYQEL